MAEIDRRSILGSSLGVALASTGLFGSAETLTSNPSEQIHFALVNLHRESAILRSVCIETTEKLTMYAA
ncbi:hypothetical protein Pr1d_37030 [Bythopirellula goksoeyrii]|uniref:Uncharacterized protein n=1 Tax=Bythopirellula goksoeyrii TaxID=1400387 RepID=A0A5B9QES7_9BACT|nr:hypothetical protein Pr1d_37030 [Bythopirellula goksoeyrii]